MCSANPKDLMRAIPSVDRILDMLGEQNLPRSVVLASVRESLDELRQTILAGQSPDVGLDAVLADVRERIALVNSRKIQPVINATGVIIHTNLGRSPMASQAVEAARQAAGHYVNLELDLATGKRGGRAAVLEQSLAALCEAEAATVVNNCAATLALVIWHFVKPEHNQVILSRGEMVQIGGGFRIHELLETAGAKLCEVGTTNQTNPADYERAIGPATAMILRVHRSNFYMEGFINSPETRDLADLARRHGKVLIEDLGGGAMFPTEPWAGEHEPTPAEVLKQGADLVLFSGDKLLGGPQSGIIAGKASMIQALKANPLFRALRCDKMSMAALEQTVAMHLAGQGDQIPVLAMMHVQTDQLTERAQRIAAQLADLPAEVAIQPSIARIGGGALPKTELPSVRLQVRPHNLSADQFATALASQTPACIGYVEDEHLNLDVRTLLPGQDDALVHALVQAFA
ncbi:MAG: L-seryl-tRNA(Sec) selenium transferase [Phycisphaeraceae bacterium]